MHLPQNIQGGVVIPCLRHPCRLYTTPGLLVYDTTPRLRPTPRAGDGPPTVDWHGVRRSTAVGTKYVSYSEAKLGRNSRMNVLAERTRTIFRQVRYGSGHTFLRGGLVSRMKGLSRTSTHQVRYWCRCVLKEVQHYS